QDSYRGMTNDPVSLHRYGYVGNNPVLHYDHYGYWFGFDDAAFIIGGAVGGVIGQAIGDVISGEVSGWDDYVASAVGGAVTAEVALYAVPATAWGAGIPGLAAAGAAGTAARHGTDAFLDNFTEKDTYQFSGSEFTTDLVVDSVLEVVGGKKNPLSSTIKNSITSKTKPVKDFFKKNCLDKVDNAFTSIKLKLNKSSVWGMNPFDRGNYIEKHLSKTDYKDWFNVGQLDNGKFPLVDFQLDNTLVSLKTVDTNGKTWMQRMKSHIKDLGKSGAMVSGQPADMILDLRVQPGGFTDAKSLIKFGEEYGVGVIIKEF
ncbi:MAG: hypothetical protein D3923_09865, partial [Candidatus Electrothrix sp. AR3]|nr:hypothetical protein [Candidatus Electrothrix sp. AR3]